MFKKLNTKKLTILRVLKNQSQTSENITPKKAKELQKQEYQTLREASNDDACTPTYEIIAQDLNSEHDQIFEAGVWYLCKIASIKTAYSSPITNILKSYIASNPDSVARIGCIKKYTQLFNIKLSK